MEENKVSNEPYDFDIQRLEKRIVFLEEKLTRIIYLNKLKSWNMYPPKLHRGGF